MENRGQDVFPYRTSLIRQPETGVAGGFGIDGIWWAISGTSIFKGPLMAFRFHRGDGGERKDKALAISSIQLSAKDMKTITWLTAYCR
jgi:hypothetical protein